MKKVLLLGFLAAVSNSSFANEYVSGLSILSENGTTISHVTHGQTVRLQYHYVDVDGTIPSSTVNTKVYINEELLDQKSYTSDMDNYIMNEVYKIDGNGAKDYEPNEMFTFCATIKGSTVDKCVDLPIYGN